MLNISLVLRGKKYVKKAFDNFALCKHDRNAPCSMQLK